MNPRPVPPPDAPELRAVPRRRLTAPLAKPASRARTSSGELPPIERLPRGGPLAASFYQQWVWEGLGGRPTADLNIPFNVIFPGVTDMPALFAAFRELERRHEGLRTRLVAAPPPQKVCQIVEPPGGMEIPLIDFSGLKPERLEAEVVILAAADASRLIDMAAKPMFRVHLLRLAAADYLALMVLHHLVGDGWSTELLRTELATLYAAFAAGRPSPLPELPVQPADYAAWQRRIAGGEILAGQIAYWRKRLAAAPPPLVVPGDRPPGPSLGGGTVQGFCWFRAPVTARLRALARAERATPAMVVLAAFGLLLSRYTGETDMVFEGKVLGRPRPELAGMVGFFMGTLLHRLDLAGDPGFAEALRRTRDGVVEDYCNQEVQYPEVLRMLFADGKSPSRLAFNMLSSPTPVSLVERAQEESVFIADPGKRPDQEKVRYDLMLQGREDPEELRLILVGAASRFTRESVAEIAADLETILVRALDDPGAPVARLLPEPRYRFARQPPAG